MLGHWNNVSHVPCTHFLIMKEIVFHKELCSNPYTGLKLKLRVTQLGLDITDIANVDSAF